MSRRTSPATSWRDPYWDHAPIIGITQPTGDPGGMIGGRGVRGGSPGGSGRVRGGMVPHSGGRGPADRWGGAATLNQHCGSAKKKFFWSAWRRWILRSFPIHSEIILKSVKYMYFHVFFLPPSSVWCWNLSFLSLIFVLFLTFVLFIVFVLSLDLFCSWHLSSY